MSAKSEGIAGRLAEKLARTAGDILKEAYHTAGVKWEQGMVELGNAMYQGTPVPMPQAITTNQLDPKDVMSRYEDNLNKAHERAVSHDEQQHEMVK